MANSIISSGNVAQGNTLAQQIRNFGKTIQGDPQKMVMDMLNSGRITQPQLQQAIQRARQIQNMIK